MEEYHSNRWDEHGLPPPQGQSTSTIALQRLALMAQGFEQDVVDAFSLLPPRDKTCLTEELARTGHKVQFERAPVSVTSVPQGPALMVYYAPALLQKAGATEALEALMVLAAVLRAARRLFPCQVGSVESTATIRIDALKVLKPSTIAQKKEWYVSRIGDLDAEVIQGPLLDGGDCRTAPLELHLICQDKRSDDEFVESVHFL